MNTIRRLLVTALIAAMDAVVQSIDEDVDLGTSRISFGPPQHLGPRDMLELLRVNRFRLRITAAIYSPGGLRVRSLLWGAGDLVARHPPTRSGLLHRQT